MINVLFWHTSKVRLTPHSESGLVIFLCVGWFALHNTVVTIQWYDQIVFSYAVPSQPRSLDGFCISIPESENSHREYLNISDDPPESIKKQYTRKPKIPPHPKREPGDSKREYINLADDESQASRREYVNLPDESEDLKQDYVNLPDESEDLKQDYVNLPDESEDPKMEYVNQEQTGELCKQTRVVPISFMHIDSLSPPPPPPSPFPFPQLLFPPLQTCT